MFKGLFIFIFERKLELLRNVLVANCIACPEIALQVAKIRISFK